MQAYTVVHRVSGGAPPFSVALFAGNSSTSLGSFSGITTDLVSPGSINQPFRAEITDANGCLQIANCSVYASAPLASNPSPVIVPVDAETGVGGFSVSWAQIAVNTSCLQFRIQQSGNTVLSGTMPGNWAPDPCMGLLPGTYGVQYSNSGCPNAATSTWGMYDYLWPTNQPWSAVQRVSFCNASHGVTIPVPPADPNPVRLPIKVFLEGPYNQAAGLMSDALRVNDKLPWHIDNGFYLGPVLTRLNTIVNMDPASRAVTGSNAYVDWVRIELRDANNPATIVYSRAALVQRDGDVVMQNGSGSLSCNITAGSYYVAVKHRNHLGVMTAAPVALDLNTPTIDLTLPTTATYGTNAQKQVGTRMVMWAGDVTGDAVLRYTGTGNDRDPILTTVGSSTPNNMLSGVYNLRDTNLDGLIKYTGSGNDRDIILTNVGSTTPNNTRMQQLP